MVTLVTFVRIHTDSGRRVDGRVYFIDNDSAIRAICSWNRGSGWEYVIKTVERVMPVQSNFQVTTNGQIIL